MRSLLFIFSVMVLAGCCHTQSARRNMPSDAAKLEESVSLLQEEIAILTKHLSIITRVEGLPEAERQQRVTAAAAAAAVADASYSHAQRVRDLQAIVEILERRKAALSLQEKDYRNRFPISGPEP